VNSAYIAIALMAVITIVVFLVIYRALEKPEVLPPEKKTFESLLFTIQNEFVEQLKQEDKALVDELEWDSIYNRKERLRKALKDCVYGIDAAKVYVKDCIFNMLMTELPTDDDIEDVVSFDYYNMEPMVRFEVLLHWVRQTKKLDTIEYIVEKYDLGEVKFSIEDGTVPSYEFNEKELMTAYRNEVPKELDYRFKLEVLATLIYQQYKGFGCIDTLREFNINGLLCGVSGAIVKPNIPDEDSATRSVFVHYKGKYIHFTFLDFKKPEELKRVIQLLIRYSQPGPLTEKRGYVVTTMYDKSRIMAARPPMAEYWCCFIRKFTLPNVDLEFLLNPKETLRDDKGNIVSEKPKYHNVELIKGMLRYLMQGQVTTAFTGRQGSGKTTLMEGCIKYVDPRLNIRVIEMAAELYLRDLYPHRNIFSAQQTDTVSATDIQDTMKKSDGALTVIGEVATDEIAARAIQAAQVASVCTIFSHHAVTTTDLVQSLRNSLVNAGGFNNSLTAEQQVVDVVRVDVHLDFNVKGERYVQRVTEVIKVAESEAYPELDVSNLEKSKAEMDREYYYRQTDRSCFTTRQLLHFDDVTKTYVVDNVPSPGLLEHMLSRIPVEDRPGFAEFIKENWGV